MHSQRCKSPCLPIAPSPVIHGIMSGPPHADLSSTSSVEDLTYWETHQQAMCGRRLTYSAEEHGWSAAAFHGQVDTFGAAVVLGRTAGGAVFGAYNPRGWIGKQSCIPLHSNHAGPHLRPNHRVFGDLRCNVWDLSLSMSHTSVPNIKHSFQRLAECGKQPHCGTSREVSMCACQDLC